MQYMHLQQNELVEANNTARVQSLQIYVQQLEYQII